MCATLGYFSYVSGRQAKELTIPCKDRLEGRYENTTFLYFIHFKLTVNYNMQNM